MCQLGDDLTSEVGDDITSELGYDITREAGDDITSELGDSKGGCQELAEELRFCCTTACYLQLSLYQ